MFGVKISVNSLLKLLANVTIETAKYFALVMRTLFRYLVLLLQTMFFKHPWVYGALYLGSIFVFAEIYLRYPEQFYQSTDTYETGHKFIKERLRANIPLRLERNRPTAACQKSLDGYREISGKKYFRCALDIKFEFAYVSDEKIYFWLRSRAKGEGEIFFSQHIQESLVEFEDNARVNSPGYVDVIVKLIRSRSTDSKTAVGETPTPEPMSLREESNRTLNILRSMGMSYDNIEKLGISVEHIRNEYRELVRYKNPDPARLNMLVTLGCESNSISCRIKLSNSEWKDINLLKAGEQEGMISPDGNRLRMFYFSVVTQTSLGYGDIVPISVFTRTTVAAQSLLGIMLIGLFLNALARLRSDH